MYLPHSNFWLFLLLLLWILACKPDKEVTPVVPRITLLSVYSVDAAQVEAKIELTGMGKTSGTEYGVVWSDKPTPTIADNKKPLITVPDVTISTLLIPDLTLGSTFYVRAYVRLADVYYYSNEITLLHQAPFIWRSLTNLKWSDKSNLVNSVDINGGILIVRPIDAFSTEVWYYIPARDTWEQLKDLIFRPSRFEPLLFKLNQFGNEAVYFGGGYQINEQLPGKYIYQKDFWQYNFFAGGTEEEWSDFPFGYSTLTHFTLDTKTFMIENRSNAKVWMLLNGIVWHKKNNFPGPFLGRHVGFSIGNKGYILVEDLSAAGKTKSLYEYNSDTDTWVQKADFPGEDRINGVAFSVKDKGYYGLGQAKDSPGGFRDIWQYDPTSDTWQKFTDYPGIGNVQVTANTILDKTYLGLGLQVKSSAAGAEEYIPATDFWELKP